MNSLFPVEEVAPVVEEAPTAEETAPAAEVLTASAPGFKGRGGNSGGDVTVFVTLNEEGAIETLTVDVSTQTAGIGDKCADEAWLAQFVGKKGPFTAGEGVDVITGSTKTCNGIIEAVNSLFPTQDMSTGTEEAPVATELTGTAKGFQSDVTVTLTVDENNVITGIAVDSTGETQGFGTRCGEDEAFLNQFIGKTSPVEADVLTGATVTSKAVIEAVNSAK